MRTRRFGAVVAAVVGLTVMATACAIPRAGSSTVIGEGPDLVSAVVNPNPLTGATITVGAREIGVSKLHMTLDVRGVSAPAGTTFGAHVHVNPCGTNPSDATLGAGAHYQDANSQVPLEDREIWLDFTVDAHGRGHAVATRHFRIAPPLARSVIIHALETDHETGVAGARLACTNVVF